MAVNEIVSMAEAARLAGVRRISIHQHYKEGKYKFFVGNKININHPDWKLYLKVNTDRIV